MSRKANKLRHRLRMVESQDRRRREECKDIVRRIAELKEQFDKTLKAQLDLVKRQALTITTPNPIHHHPRLMTLQIVFDVMAYKMMIYRRPMSANPAMGAGDPRDIEIFARRHADEAAVKIARAIQDFIEGKEQP